MYGVLAGSMGKCRASTLCFTLATALWKGELYVKHGGIG